MNIYLCMFVVYFAPASFCYAPVHENYEEWIDGCSNNIDTHVIEVAAQDYWGAEQELYASVGCKWEPMCTRLPEEARFRLIGAGASHIGFEVDMAEWRQTVDWIGWYYILYEMFELPCSAEYEPNSRILICENETRPYGSVECYLHEDEAYGKWRPVCMEEQRSSRWIRG